MFTLKIISMNLNPFWRLQSVDRTFSRLRGYEVTGSSDYVTGNKRVINHNGIKYTWRK